MKRDQVDELLGAWALDALDESARDEIDRDIAMYPELVRRSDAMRHVTALLGESLAGAPPADLRDRLLSAATARSAESRVTASTPLEVFAHQVAALRALLTSLSPDDWQAEAAPYAWTVHGLVAHLLVIEKYTAQQLGLGGTGAYAADEHHLALGTDEIRDELARPPRDTVEAWDRRATSTLEQLHSSPDVDAELPVTMHGWPFTVGSVLIARGFELWTHADDIRRATGRSLEAPCAADLRAMSSFSVASLPLLVSVVAPDVPVRPARVVLTGAGGGTFDLPAGSSPEQRQLTIVTDLVDYCRLVARRIDPDELDATVEGDGELAGALFAAARVFAM
ncbi:MAG: maleylpyruvate isomerase family mycothiol-dependent enzyme [Acidimicrobiia bacterium]